MPPVIQPPSPSMPVSQAPATSWRAGFTLASASGPDGVFFNTVGSIGSGMAVSQSSGNLVVTTGTTAYAETTLRSAVKFIGNMNLKWFLSASQAIANNTCTLELVDVIGDALPCTVNGTTSITVTTPFTAATAADVGKTLTVCNISGIASAPSQDGVIASVNGNTITLTVSGFPSSGTGTVTLQGKNRIQTVYTGTSATSVSLSHAYDGYLSSASATVNSWTTGHQGEWKIRNSEVGFLDQVGSSETAPGSTLRYSRRRNVLLPQTQTYVQLRFTNGSTAPASTTTYTVGFVETDSFNTQQVEVIGTSAFSISNPLPVQVTGSAALPTGAATAAKQDTGNNSLASIDSKTPALGAATIVNSTPVAIASDQIVPVSPVGQGVVATSTVTRAANTTVYTSGDVVGGPLTIANAGASGGNTVFNSISLLQNLTAVPSGQTSFRLHLYNTTPPSAIADNSPFTLGSGDRAAYLGYIDIGTPALVGTGTGTPYAQAPVGQIGFKLAAASTSLFGYLVTNGGFTPAANSETYTLWLNGVQA